MAPSAPGTVQDYLSELAPDRRQAIEVVRAEILANLPDGFVEAVNWGMICYEVPLTTYSETYNRKPLMLAALASQKRHMAVYLTAMFARPDLADWFVAEYEASGKKLDMGKSCVRFTKLDNLPVALIGETIARVDLESFLDIYRSAKSNPK